MLKKLIALAAFLSISTVAFAQPSPPPSGWQVIGPNVVFDNGSALLPRSVTGGGKGVGTINVSGNYYINGAAAQITINGTACLLKASCTITATASSLTVGTTVITGGTTNGILFNNGGVLGNTTPVNNAVFVTSGAGVPSSSTTLPSGLAMGTPASIALNNGTNLPLTTGVSGVLPPANGGLGINTSLSNGVAVFSSGNPTFTAFNGSGAFVRSVGGTLVVPDIGTPSAAVLTNATGLPISTGVSGLGAGVATWLATPTSANLATVVTDETGSGALVFANSPVLVTPNLGTPSAINLTNATAFPYATGGTGILPAANGGFGANVSASSGVTLFASGVPSFVGFVGSGSFVRSTGGTLVAPDLGTPSVLVGTNITGTAAGLTAGTVTTNANLTGEVTSVGNATTVTNAAVIGKVLTAFAAGAGTVSSSDSILTAFQKVVGNIALKADILSPTLTGTPSAPTAAADTNTTQLATTAFVLGQKGTANPLVNGTVAPGTSPRYSPQDHVHPTDTSRAAAANSVLTGTTDAQGTLRLSSFVTSTQLTANANNYTATDGSNTCSTKGTLRISTNASRNITGLSCGQVEGDLRIIQNVGAFPAVLTNQDAGSTAANQFLFGSDLTLAANSSITVRWDGVTSRWRAVVSPGAGGGGGSGAVTLAAGSGIAVSGTCTSIGTATGTCTISISATITPQHRVTLTSGTPVMIASASGQTIVYVSPSVGNLIPIFDGTNFTPTAFAETSQATTDTTKSPSAVGASLNYDIFCWIDTGPVNRCTRGPDWTVGGGSATARGTGVGSTDLVRVNGIWMNSQAITNGPAAQRGTYMGTIRSNASSTIDFIYGTSASGGGAATFNVWNMYNRVRIGTTVVDSGAGYTYSGAVRQARASTSNQINFVTGMAEDSPIFNYTTDTIIAAVSGAFYQLGVGFDGVASIQGTAQISQNPTGVNSGFRYSNTAVYSPPPQLGSHFAAALERSDGANANTFDNGSNNALIGQFRM